MIFLKLLKFRIYRSINLKKSTLKKNDFDDNDNRRRVERGFIIGSAKYRDRFIEISLHAHTYTHYTCIFISHKI